MRKNFFDINFIILSCTDAIHRVHNATVFADTDKGACPLVSLANGRAGGSTDAAAAMPQPYSIYGEVLSSRRWLCLLGRAADAGGG